MINIIMLALFVEAIVSAIKPIWKDGGKGLSVTEIVSIVIGIVMAVALRIDLFSALVGSEIVWKAPPWVDYVFYAMSGIAIGRGPSFVYDLWKDIKKWSETNLAESVTDEIKVGEPVIDLEITHWSVARLKRFCEDNDIPCDGCVTKDDYIDAIVDGTTEEPPNSRNDN